MKQAEIDIILGNHASGSVASRLLANGMNVDTLRLWEENGLTYMDKNDKAERVFMANATLRKDEWKHLDDTVVQIATQRMVGVGDLVSRGLTYNIPNGLGTTVLEYEDVSDMEPAQVDMYGEARGPNDRLEFDLNYLPLPLIHKNFRISTRVLQASRNRGASLDIAQAAVASRLVAEKIETILFTGASTYTFGGGTIYGYMDHPHRNQVTMATAWDASAATGAKIVADVLSMVQASITDRHFGPWILYVPTGYDALLSDDYSTAKGDLTIRGRIKQIEGIEDVKTAAMLTAANVLLVEMRPETVRMVIGLPVTTVEWQTDGNMIFNFKVMSIMVPQIRADQDDRSGIIHLS